MDNLITNEQVIELLGYMNRLAPAERLFIKYEIKTYSVDITQKCGHEYYIWISDILNFLNFEDKEKNDILNIIGKLKSKSSTPEFNYVAGDPFW